MCCVVYCSHPDKNRDNPEAAEEAFREIAMANDIIGNPKQRKGS